MILRGKNKLVLNEQSLSALLEDAINSALLDGEDYIRVTGIKYTYVGDDFEVFLTTDRPTMEVTNVEP